MQKEYRSPLTSWECYTGFDTFLNCEPCARQFAVEYEIELDRGLHTYGTGRDLNSGVMECYACGHEFDTVPTCDGCGEFLRGYLLPEAVEALPKNEQIIRNG
jgi:hypothetical protein